MIFINNQNDQKYFMAKLILFENIKIAITIKL